MGLCICLVGSLDGWFLPFCCLRLFAVLFVLCFGGLVIVCIWVGAGCFGGLCIRFVFVFVVCVCCGGLLRWFVVVICFGVLGVFILCFVSCAPRGGFGLFVVFVWLVLLVLGFGVLDLFRLCLSFLCCFECLVV